MKKVTSELGLRAAKDLIELALGGITVDVKAKIDCIKKLRELVKVTGIEPHPLSHYTSNELKKELKRRHQVRQELRAKKHSRVAAELAEIAKTRFNCKVGTITFQV